MGPRLQDGTMAECLQDGTKAECLQDSTMAECLQDGTKAGLHLLDHLRLLPSTGTLDRGYRFFKVREASFLKFREDQHWINLDFERTFIIYIRTQSVVVLETGLTGRPALTSDTIWTISSWSGKLMVWSLEWTLTPPTRTSNEVLRPTVPVHTAPGTLARTRRASSSYRGPYPHPPQYSTSTVTGLTSAIVETFNR